MHANKLLLRLRRHRTVSGVFVGKNHLEILSSFFLIWQSLFFGQSRADSSSFLKFRVLQGNQSIANLKTSTQSYLFYFGSFGIGLTEIDIKNETDTFKYDMKDLSLDLGFQMTSSFSVEQVCMDKEQMLKLKKRMKTFMHGIQRKFRLWSICSLWV